MDGRVDGARATIVVEGSLRNAIELVEVFSIQTVASVVVDVEEISGLLSLMLIWLLEYKKATDIVPAGVDSIDKLPRVTVFVIIEIRKVTHGAAGLGA